MTRPQPWRISVDTGGTFTDCWAVDPTGEQRRCKVLSSGCLRTRVAAVANPPRVIRIEDAWNTPDGFFAGFTFRARPAFASRVTGWNAARQELALDEPLPPDIGAGTLVELSSDENAPVLGARILTGTALADAFPALELRLATTIGTNALLERKVARVLFLVTRGFADLLRIRDQRRPDLFALDHRLPRPLHDDVLEIDERLDAEGNVITPLAVDAPLAIRLREFHARGIRSAAIALLHSYRNPVHERQLAGALAAAGFGHVSLSSELAPFIKLLPRAETAVVNACLSPIVDSFLDGIHKRLAAGAGQSPATGAGAGAAHLVMTSSGGLVPRAACRAKDMLLSGPAGGVVGAAAAARACGHEKIITFDMGGTSTDVARVDGDFIYRFQQRVGDAALFAPALNIHTVAAGGGSICRYDPVAGLTVGPESAGADPGPACYGKGGPLTITDVNLLLGRIDPDKATIPLDRAASRIAFEELLAAMGAGAASDKDAGPARASLLEGLLAIAVERMADAIRTISIREGAAPEEHTLVAFGGAGPLHACAVAEHLGIRRILVPADAGLLSAFGLYHAVLERFAEEQVLRELRSALPSVAEKLASLAREALDLLTGCAAAGDAVAVRRRIAELRLCGQDSTLAIEIGSNPAELEARFATRYAEIYGYAPPVNRPLELVTLRVVASAAPPLVPREEVNLPLNFSDRFSTLHVAPGWTAASGSRGSAFLTKTPSASPSDKSEISDQKSEIALELFRNRFQNIVEEMGARLQRSALSTNIKERADFSCALLDARGRLVVNAPHIPVHLGALGLCVRGAVAAIAAAGHCPLRPGDMLITNHPAFGGSHLPDVTLISPVFAAAPAETGRGVTPENGPGVTLVAFLANRAHHAEIGGITPGSMPPNASNLAEEGAVIPPTFLYRAGVPDYAAVEFLLTAGAAHPTRNPSDNIADLHAQAAANLHGVRAVEALVAAFGLAAVRAHLDQITARSRDALRAVLRQHPLAPARAREELDDGTAIALALSQEGGTLHLDFTGTTAPRHPRSLNATPAVVQSAVLYVLRLFTRTALPLNEGLLDDVRLTLPECFLNPAFGDDPAQCPAVVGGNVETSQRLVDTLLKALRLQACSQGTMNNFIFGDDTFGYYETIAGGSGAGPGYAGCGPLHTHMTNTAITDPEILEHRYPVRLRAFSVRRGSGGDGAYRGGDGAIREIEFLRPLTVSLLTQHRLNAPYGVDGGCPGAPGRQVLIAPGGETQELPPSVEIAVPAGARLRIETPGGGGWGRAAG